MPPDAAGFVGYLEWMLDLKVTQAQSVEVAGLIARAWATRKDDEMKLVTRGMELEKDLANYSQAERDGLRSSVEDNERAARAHESPQRQRATGCAAICHCCVWWQPRRSEGPGDGYGAC